jgi:hypothetical protein
MMRRKKLFRVVIYIMLLSMLLSTLMMGIGAAVQ